MVKRRYESPRITEERDFETQAMACAKVPGRGDPLFCGPVFLNRVDGKFGCVVNESSRSS